jgi:ABC-type spermidine/putrescine transport system permease subunit I
MRARRGLLVNLAPPAAYLVLAFFLPLLSLLAYSFWHLEEGEIARGFTLANYVTVFTRPLYLFLLAKSIGIGAFAATVCLLVAYPLAYFLRFKAGRYRTGLLMLAIICMLSSYIVRVYAWKIILSNSGMINSLLLALHLIRRPLESLLYSNTAVTITFVYIFLPFTLLPLYASLSNIDESLLEASRDLGAGSAATFWRVTLPLSRQGIIAGTVLTFILAAGDYITPALVGGQGAIMAGVVIQQQFGIAYNWPLGSAIAFALLGTTAMAVAVWTGIISRALRRAGGGSA